MFQSGLGVQGFLRPFQPVVLALGLSGGFYACGSEDPFPNGTIPPLGGGGDSGLNNIGPQGKFDLCMPPKQSLMVLVKGQGAVFGNPPTMPADGSLAISINRQSLRFPDGGGGGAGGGASVSADGLVHFTAIGQWASGRTPTAAQPKTQLEDGRITNRVGGDPLTKLLRPNPNGVGNIRWSDQFAIFANPDPMVNDSNHDGINDKDQLGFLWDFEGAVDPTNCHVSMGIRTTARQLGDQGPVLDYFVFPQYSDGQNDPDFSDEVVTIQRGPLKTPDSNPFVLPQSPDAAGRRRSQEITVCSGNCKDVDGAASNPQEIRMQLIVEPLKDSGAGGSGGAGG